MYSDEERKERFYTDRRRFRTETQKGNRISLLNLGLSIILIGIQDFKRKFNYFMEILGKGMKQLSRKKEKKRNEGKRAWNEKLRRKYVLIVVTGRQEEGFSFPFGRESLRAKEFQIPVAKNEVAPRSALHNCCPFYFLSLASGSRCGFAIGHQVDIMTI